MDERNDKVIQFVETGMAQAAPKKFQPVSKRGGRTILVRGMPEAMHKAIRIKAAAEDQGVNDVVLDLLAKALGVRQP